MSLDVGLSSGPSFVPDLAPRLALEDDGYYWFLYPLFEKLAERTRQMIDLYGDAEFQGPSLDALRETVAEGRRMVESRRRGGTSALGTIWGPKWLPSTRRNRYTNRLTGQRSSPCSTGSTS